MCILSKFYKAFEKNYVSLFHVKTALDYMAN